MLNKLRTTWSFDPHEAIWWCGVLDTSIPEPDVMDWSEDWSYSESSPCAEDVFLEQSQAMALISDDVSSPECVQQAEVLVAEANRTLAQARSAVASAKQKSQWFLPSFQRVFQSKGQRQGQGERQIERFIVSHLWPGDSVLNDSRKDLAKEVKMDLARFVLGASWGFDSELFETVVLQADVVLDCGATETAGVVEAVQILVTQGFSDSRVEMVTDHGFVLLMVTGARLSQESGC